MRKKGSLCLTTRAAVVAVAAVVVAVADPPRPGEVLRAAEGISFVCQVKATRKAKAVVFSKPVMCAAPSASWWSSPELAAVVKALVLGTPLQSGRIDLRAWANEPPDAAKESPAAAEDGQL